MSRQPEMVVIVGAGLGGVTATAALRQAGNSGRIVLVNGEAELPYDRPPLSKGILQDVDALMDIHLEPATWYEENKVELTSDARATSIRPSKREIELDDGRVLVYDKLLLATGSEVRRIPQLEQDRIPYYYLRSYRDAAALKSGLAPGKRLLLVGAGVIGLEVAASARQLGCEVTVVEMLDRVMARSVPERISVWLQAQHEAQGVRFFLKDSVAAFEEDGVGLKLASGVTIAADLMLICAGVTPSTKLAEDSGIRCNNGVVVDEYCRTSAADIYAIGDLCCYPDAWQGKMVRSENWMHAQRQAECAALNIQGQATRYQHLQSVWTDQYDFKLQFAGVLQGDREVVRGDPNSKDFMAFYLHEGRLGGTLGVNQPKLMRVAQNMIKSRAKVNVDLLADSKANLRQAMRKVSRAHRIAAGVM